jgi:hypothetical protein
MPVFPQPSFERRVSLVGQTDLSPAIFCPDKGIICKPGNKILSPTAQMLGEKPSCYLCVSKKRPLFSRQVADCLSRDTLWVFCPQKFPGIFPQVPLHFVTLLKNNHLICLSKNAHVGDSARLLLKQTVDHGTVFWNWERCRSPSSTVSWTMPLPKNW